MPAPPGLIDRGLLDNPSPELPGARPPITWPSFEPSVKRGSELLTQNYGHLLRIQFKIRYPIPVIEAPEEDPEEAPEVENEDGPEPGTKEWAEEHCIQDEHGNYIDKKDEERWKRHLERVMSGENVEAAEQGLKQARNKVAACKAKVRRIAVEFWTDVALEVATLGLSSAFSLAKAGVRLLKGSKFVKNLSRLIRGGGRLLKGKNLLHGLSLLDESGSVLAGFISGSDYLAKLGGRLGGFAHRLKILKWSTRLARWGWKVRSGCTKLGERLIKCPRGLRNRYPDIYATKGNKILIIQFGKSYKRGLLKGTPSRREIEALIDLISETGTWEDVEVIIKFFFHS